MKTSVDTFRQSLARVVGNGAYNHEFIGRFYELFVGRSHRIADMFKDTDMAAQHAMLHDSLSFLADYALSGKAGPQLQNIARVHGRSRRNIPPELYDAWLDSLVEAVSEFDPEFNEEVELAWRLALIPGITYMKFMHQRA